MALCTETLGNSMLSTTGSECQSAAQIPLALFVFVFLGELKIKVLLVWDKDNTSVLDTLRLGYQKETPGGVIGQDGEDFAWGALRELTGSFCECVL